VRSKASPAVVEHLFRHWRGTATASTSRGFDGGDTGPPRCLAFRSSRRGRCGGRNRCVRRPDTRTISGDDRRRSDGRRRSAHGRSYYQVAMASAACTARRMRIRTGPWCRRPSAGPTAAPGAAVTCSPDQRFFAMAEGSPIRAPRASRGTVAPRHLPAGAGAGSRLTPVRRAGDRRGCCACRSAFVRGDGGTGMLDRKIVIVRRRPPGRRGVTIDALRQRGSPLRASRSRRLWPPKPRRTAVGQSCLRSRRMDSRAARRRPRRPGQALGNGSCRAVLLDARLTLLLLYRLLEGACVRLGGPPCGEPFSWGLRAGADRSGTPTCPT
jgi:hypothetical protein